MITVDVNSIIGELVFTKSQINDLRELTAKSYADEAYTNTVQLAQERLATSKFDYINALSVRRENRFTYALVLEGVFPLMLENGASSFDMKDGFSRSDKIKTTKSGGWYLTIPFIFRTTSANPASGQKGQILPRSIYDLIRNSPAKKFDLGNFTISILKGDQIPLRYQPGAIKEMSNKVDQYIPKSSIYAGLQRKQNKETGQSGYNTFRRVSSNSDPNSWIHPGITAYKLMDEALNNIDRDDLGDLILQKFLGDSEAVSQVPQELANESATAYTKTLGNINTAL